MTDRSLLARVLRRARRLFAPPPPPAPEPRDRHLWAIGLVEGDDPLALAPARGPAAPLLTRDDVHDVRASFVADPFLVQDAGRTHLFFEVFNLGNRRGEIALATSDDLATWRYDRVVLREPFHLSYPHVFQSGSRWYMIPETHATSSIRLYEATEFPYGWHVVDTLLTGLPFNDATPFEHDGRWWMFVETAPRAGNDTLRLYHAPTLRGPWMEHPQSPVVRGNRRTARPGGRVLQHGGRLVRFGQDCEAAYGAGLQAFEIVTLTTDAYAERPLAPAGTWGPSGAGWNADGMHHVDAVQRADGRWVGVVDGWRWATRSDVLRLG